MIAHRPRRLSVLVASSLALSWAFPIPVLAQVPAGAEFRVNTYVTSYQGSPAVAMADGGYVVAWESDLQDGSQLGVYARRYAADGAPAGAEFRVNTYTTGVQLLPAVAMAADGKFVVAWASFGQDGSESGVYAQRYTADGTPAGAEFRVNTVTAGDQSAPSVAMAADGRFVVAWLSFGQDGSGYGVYAQRYAADGTPAGAEFRVNTYTTGAQRAAATAMAADGGVVVAWESDLQDGSVYGVYAQRYAADGTPAGAEFRVNTYTTSAQQTPAVAMAADGSFVVAWESFGQDASGGGVYAQRYAADGTPAGAEFRVNTHTTSEQESPAAAMAASGSFVVAWETFGQDDEWDVYAQRFAADGTPEGAEFRVNTGWGSDQQEPAAAMTADGSFVVAWESGLQDTSEYDVYAQRYGGLFAASLQVDPTGNGILEPGETVSLRPAWRNVNGAAQTFGGGVSNFSGPPGATYLSGETSADYGTVANGATQECVECYDIHVSLAGPRPATHWDAHISESLTPDVWGISHAWTLHIGESFADVPTDQTFYAFVETLLHNGTTLGCGGDHYCPAQAVERWQMAIFIARADAGSDEAVPTEGSVDGQPYDCTSGGTSLFSDVAPDALECRHVHYIAERGVTLGCGGDQYCPALVVSRWQMAMFMARAMAGDDDSVPQTYGPDPDTGHSYSCDPDAPNVHFSGDVAVDDIFCRHVHYLWANGVVSGTSDTTYAPDLDVTRDQMAKFLVNGFGQTLYGP